MRLAISAILATSLHATSAAAGMFDFSCGNIEFTIDFEKSTVSDTIDGSASVDWQYDGDWVRWNVKDTDEFFGVNVKTGDLILDGVVNQAVCRMGDTSGLVTLPLSEGAYLRRSFIDLPEQKRMEIQSVLSQTGYYSSDIDGKWGRGTEAAIKAYVAENQEEMPSADYTSPEGAANTLLGAMSHMNIDPDCLDCEGAYTAEIDVPPVGNPESVGSENNSKPGNEFFDPNFVKMASPSLYNEIVSNGGDLLSIGPDQRTTLHYAVRYGSVDLVEYLIASGVDVNRLNVYGNSPLHWAVAPWDDGAPEITLLPKARALLSAGANVNAQTVAGETPLMFAWTEEIALVLIENGADPSIKQKDGYDAATYNSRAGRSSVGSFISSKLQSSNSKNSGLSGVGTFYFSCSGTDWNNDLSLDFSTSKFSGGFEHSNGFENPLVVDWEYDGEELRFTPAESSFAEGFAAFNSGSVSLARYVKNSNGIFSVLPGADVICRTNGLDVLEKLPLSDSRSKKEAAIRASELANRVSEVTPEKLEELKGSCTSSVLISGICWRQSFDEMKLVMTGRGFDCDGPANELAAVYGFKFICEKGDAWVRIEESRINFSCANFNMCSYSVEETAQFIVNEGLVDTLKPDAQVINGNVFKSFCGRGKDGEELCATESQDILGTPTVVITLDRGASGEAAPSFD
jgi:hypothetical protein